MNETLILNADAQPISLLPTISSISWQEAIKFLCVGAAETLHTYDGWEVRSPSITMAVPSVVILKKQVKIARSWTAADSGGLQKHLVFLRDMYVCQYCCEAFPRNRLTLDHVVPRFYGGKTKWDNITTACETCNHRRGHDISQKPKMLPFKPTYGYLVKNLKKFPMSMPDLSWNYYLGWDENKIRLINPRNGKLMNETFDFGLQIRLELTD